MKHEQDPKAQNDIMVIAIMIGVAILLFVTFADIGVFWRACIIMQLLLAFAAGFIGKDRKIGFSTAFFLGLLIPLLGFIFALSSTKNADEEYREKMLDIAGNHNGASSIADQLYRLNELRKEGVLTEDEFYSQKEKLLNS